MRKNLMHIRKRIWLVLLMLVMFMLHSFSKPVGTDESAVKAMFIYNFTKYFDWSQLDSKQEFVIGVYGNSDVARYLTEIAYRKTVNGKMIVIKDVNSIADTHGIQMLFISDQSEYFLDVVRKNNLSESFIIISENRNAIRKGSHINLLNADGKLRFELNETGLKTNNIKFSRELALLAIKIY